jgi:hypothetical protein
MAVKYYCDCCGNETEVPEEYMNTEITISLFTKRKAKVFKTSLSGQEILRFEQSLCDGCKRKIAMETNEFMKQLRTKYSKELRGSNFDWEFNLEE